MKHLILHTFFIIIFTSTLFSQSDWVIYKPNNSGLPFISIAALAIDGTGNIWIGGNLGPLTKFYDGEWTVYSSYGIPGPAISIATDASNNVWIGTQNAGLTKFDGTSSTVYSTSNSGLPHNEVRSIIVDKNGKIWAGTAEGVVIFDGSNWTVYNTSNSNLPHNNIFALAIDNDNNVWVGTLGGLAKFSSTGWTVYNQTNSGLPANRVNCIVIDGIDNKWIGTTAGGVAKYDGSTWTIFNESNSQLPYNSVYALALETNGNKWIGTYGGLAVYREGGVVSVEEILESIPNEFMLLQNYPNPFNPETIIGYQVPVGADVSLKVYDVSGKKVITLVNQFQNAGRYNVIFGNIGSELSSGVYFYTLQAGNFKETKKMLLLR